MSSLPSVKEMLGLLDTLASAVRDFAEREEKLNGDYRARSAAERDRYESLNRQQDSASAARMAQAEAGFNSAMSRCQSRFEKRKARILHAHGVVRVDVMGDIRGTEERGKYKIQETALQAEHRRDAELASAAAAFEQFQQNLGDLRERFTQLERAAARAFRGYRPFRNLLAPERSWPEPDLTPDEHRLLEGMQRLHEETRDELERFQRRPWPKVFRYCPVWLATFLLLGLAAAVPVLRHFGIHALSWAYAGAALVVLAVVWAAYVYGRRTAGPPARSIAGKLGRARRTHDACYERAELHCRQEQERIKAEFTQANRALNQEWRRTVKGALDQRGVRPLEVDEKAQRTYRRNEEQHRGQRERIERDHAVIVSRLRDETVGQARRLAETHAVQQAKLEGEYQAAWKTLEADWRKTVGSIFDAIRRANDIAEKLFPDWTSPAWEKWALPEAFQNAAKFGRLEVNVKELAETLPKDKRLALPGPAVLSVPLVLAYPLQGSILFETGQDGRGRGHRGHQQHHLPPAWPPRRRAS